MYAFQSVKSALLEALSWDLFKNNDYYRVEDCLDGYPKLV